MARALRALGLSACLAAISGIAITGGCRKPTAAAPDPDEALRAEFLTQHRLQGQVALMEFGLVGCQLSGEGLDSMIQLHKDNAIPGLMFVRVEESKDADAAERYYKSKPLPFPVYRDGSAAMARAFDATAYPTFVVVDKFGNVRYRGKFPPVRRLAEWVSAMLAETKDAGPDAPQFGQAQLDYPSLLAGTKLPALTGGPVKPLGQYAGRKGLLAVFVDTHCPFSEIAVGNMPGVGNKLARQGIACVLVNLDDPEPAVRNYYAKHKADSPVLFDATPATKNLWAVTSVPTVIFLDAKGGLLYRGKALWDRVAAAGEKGLGLPPGTLKFQEEGTGFG